jgi:hypothetical protein
MTPKQHATQIANNFKKDYIPKYMKGQEEHGGQLWLKPGMLQRLREETLDFVSYSDVLKQQIETARDLLEQGNYEETKYWLDQILYEGEEMMLPDSDDGGDGFHGIR